MASSSKSFCSDSVIKELVTSLQSLTLTNLPNELLIKIFRFLNVKELKRSSLVCKLFAEVIAHHNLPQQSVLNLNHFSLNAGNDQVIIYEELNRKYPVIKLTYPSHGFLDLNSKFWTKIGEHCKTLILKYGYEVSAFSENLQYFPNIQRIELCELDFSLDYFNIYGITELHFTELENLIPRNYKRSVDLCMNLRSLTIENLYIVSELDFDVKMTEMMPFTKDFSKFLNSYGVTYLKISEKFNLLEEKMLDFKDIKDFEYQSILFPFTPYDLSKLTSLEHFELNADGSDIGCMDFHVDSKIESIKTIKVRLPRKKYCETCMQSIKNFLPNFSRIENHGSKQFLEKFLKIVEKRIKYIEVRNPLKFVKPNNAYLYLETLVIKNCNRPSMRCLMIETKYWPMLPNLKKIEFRKIGGSPGLFGITDEHFEILVHKTPLMESFSFNGSLSKKQIMAMERGWKFIGDLYFHNGIEHIDILINCGKEGFKELKYLENADRQRTDVMKVKKLFDQIPSLRYAFFTDRLRLENSIEYSTHNNYS